MAKTAKIDADKVRFAALQAMTDRIKRYTQETGRVVDDATAVLAHFLADPDHGQIKIQLHYQLQKDHPAGHIEVKVGSIFYEGAYMAYFGFARWGGTELNDVQTKLEQSQAMEKDGWETLEINLNLCNVCAVLDEWGIARPNMALLMELAGDVAAANPQRLAIINSAMEAGYAGLHLNRAPFNEFHYLRMVINGPCSPALRQQLVSASNPSQACVMHAAIWDDRIDWIRALCANGFPINETGRREFGLGAPLHRACCSKEATELLLSLGADPNIRDHNLKTPLHASIHREVAQRLIAHGADIMAQDEKGLTPLHYAIEVPAKNRMDGEIGLMQVIHPMLDAGADPFYVPDNPPKGYLTPFQHAVERGAKLQVELLARRFDVDWAQKTVGGRSLVQLCGKDREMKDFLRSLRTQVTIEKAMAAPNEEEARASMAKRGFSPL